MAVVPAAALAAAFLLLLLLLLRVFHQSVTLYTQMSCSNLRYGPGVTREVGMDLANLRAKKVIVYFSGVGVGGVEIQTTEKP